MRHMSTLLTYCKYTIAISSLWIIEQMEHIVFVWMRHYEYYLCGLVVTKVSAIGGVEVMSVGQMGGGEGAGGRGGGGGGGPGLQAVEGVAPRGQHHSYPGKEPASELILDGKTHKAAVLERSISSMKLRFLYHLVSHTEFLTKTRCEEGCKWKVLSIRWHNETLIIRSE